MQNEVIEGACLCGTARYRITGEVKGCQYCHCSRCRKFTGSAHAANLFVRPDALSWTAGEESVGTYTLQGEPNFPTAFCKQCGSGLRGRPRGAPAPQHLLGQPRALVRTRLGAASSCRDARGLTTSLAWSRERRASSGRAQ